MKPCFIALVAFALGACRATAPDGSEPPGEEAPAPSVPSPSSDCSPPPQTRPQCGMASWYGEKHSGKKTASGERFNENARTAAHRELPLESIVLVCNPANGKGVEVRLNDRGPANKGRIIDLSKASFTAIADLAQGKVRVCLYPGLLEE